MTAELSTLTPASTVPLLLNDAEAAAFLGLGRDHFAELKSKGLLPKQRRVPPRLMLVWHRKDLESWAAGLHKNAHGVVVPSFLR